jgi:outer membrane lipoprotein-sorting protein
MHSVLKAAAVLLAGAGGVAYFAGPRPGASPAFAEVARPLREARTLAYRMTTEFPGVKQPVALRVLFKEPGLVRHERPGELAAVADLKARKMLILDFRSKTALLQEGLPAEEQDSDEWGPARMVEQLRKLVEKEGKPAGKKHIGGVEAEGFLVRCEGKETAVWADPKSKRPLFVEMAVRVSGGEARVVLSDFEFNPELDDVLFRLTPPEGYEVRTVKAEPGTPDDDIARLLRLYAEKSGGAFPRRFDDWADYDRVLGTKAWKPTDPQSARLMDTLARVHLFLQKYRKNFSYKADGVKLGDAGKVLCWYPKDGTTQYRAIYGDLHAADVAADQLPEKPK